MLVGPVVTRYELELQPGVKASKVTSIDTDLARVDVPCDPCSRSDSRQTLYWY